MPFLDEADDLTGDGTRDGEDMTADPPSTSSAMERHHLERGSFKFRVVQWLNSLAALSPKVAGIIPASIRRPNMSPEVRAMWQGLQLRTMQGFDRGNADHRALLRRLWTLAFRDTASLAESQRDNRWKEMGWQRDDPTSDFRGAGLLCLQNLVYLAESYPEVFARLMHKKRQPRSEPDYPFATASVNVTFLVTEILGLDAFVHASGLVGKLPETPAACGFVELLDDTGPSVLDDLYCEAIDLLDAHYVAQRASYMDFPKIIKEVRHALIVALARYPRDLHDVHVCALNILGVQGMYRAQ